MSRQLVLALPVRAALGREDFMVSSANAEALAALADPARWPAGRMVLIGPAGAGKTHLIHVWAAESGARILGPEDLAAAPDRVAAAPGPLAVDDAAAAAGDPAAERGLLHLVNLLAEAGAPLLLAAREPAARWPLGLPDLASRLAASGQTRIGPPDDALLAAVLAKQLADRQLAVQRGVIDYLVPRMERSFAAARQLAALLDRLSLAEKRPIGRALAARALDMLGAGGE
ncbi:MAG: chromosomal replication initiator DnaA [Alphaproteobacteria bacterium]|nr:MAG: chromosomal replication initiator DnaA [Alphaproteobacteria bacterium]